jgi:tRNA threonylcarbamoyladenosine modification (KEOPS) complex Cgi121 subunit
MLIERIFYKEEILFVGIGELRNETMKNKDELISLSSSHTTNSTVVQFLSPKLIAGPIHLLSAARNAINAVRGNYAISRSLNIEIIVYASAQRQIEHAFQLVGLGDISEKIGVVVIAESKDSIHKCFERLFKQVGSDIVPAFRFNRKRMGKIMKAFEVSKTELRTFTDSDNLEDLQDALVRCIVSKISMVALDA